MPGNNCAAGITLRVPVLPWLLLKTESTFPEAHAHLKVEHVGAGGWSRLFTWTGTDKDLLPMLFIRWEVREF
jgi:hypothetical protein